MKAKVFVPCTDEMMERMMERGARLVPYHPDRPCWRLDQRGTRRIRRRVALQAAGTGERFHRTEPPRK